MLSWSAQETDREVHLAPIATGEGDPGLPGGPQLVALGRGAAGDGQAGRLFRETADVIGEATATDAAAVAANFEIMNRVVDAVGLPVGQKRRQDMAPTIAELGLDSFPHAVH